MATPTCSSSLIWQSTQRSSCSSKQEAKFRPALTVASPDLSQVAAALTGLFAELNNIPARCLRGDGHLSHSLFPIAEVHRQYHLKEEWKKQSGGDWEEKADEALTVMGINEKVIKERSYWQLRENFVLYENLKIFEINEKSGKILIVWWFKDEAQPTLTM